MKKLLNDFKEFITTGNLIAIAIGLLMGAAIGSLVTSLTTNIISPVISMFAGKENFDEALIFEINNAKFKVGAFITTIINFLVIALVAFFIVKISTKVFPPKEKEQGPTEVELLTEIRDSLKK